MHAAFTPSPHPVRALLLTLGAMLAGTAHAAPQAPRADLKVELAAPATVEITRPTTYLVTVTNLAGQTSGAITARVRLPLTNTSPQVYILGTVSGLDSRCAVAANELVCNLAGLRKGWSTSFAYTYSAPVSTKPLQMSASVASATADPQPGNNSQSVVPNLVYPVRPISSANVRTRLCTGTGLTAFFECTLFPSSISSFDATLNADQSIVVSGMGTVGQWSQNATRTSLRMAFVDGTGATTSEFNGWAINGANCFHGLTRHLSGSGNYVSPYEVCIL
jgi:Domain of unknown function DUF11